MDQIQFIYDTYIYKYFAPALDILIVAYIIHVLYKVFVGTKTMQTLKGIGIIFLAYVIGKALGLKTFVWIFEKGLEVAAIAIVILFQNEIRRVIMKLGENTPVGSFFRRGETEIQDIITVLPPTVYRFSETRTGALIVISKKTGLRGFIERGVELDAHLSQELLESIFYSKNPLHDGAVIISGSRVAAASCVLPLTERTDLEKIFGTRHRAAIGLSEETDSVIVVVSEENGSISIAHEGKLYYALKSQKFEATLTDFLTKQTEKPIRAKSKKVKDFFVKAKEKLLLSFTKQKSKEDKQKLTESSEKVSHETDKEEEKTHV